MRNANNEIRESLRWFDRLGISFIEVYGSPFIAILYFLGLPLSMIISRGTSTGGYIELFLLAVIILGVKQLIRHQQIQADIQAASLLQLQNTVYQLSEWNNCRLEEEDWNKLSAIVETIVGNKVALLEKLNKNSYEGKTTRSNRSTTRK